jgi:hypothetical protein
LREKKLHAKLAKKNLCALCDFAREKVARQARQEKTFAFFAPLREKKSITPRRQARQEKTFALFEPLRVKKKLHAKSPSPLRKNLCVLCAFAIARQSNLPLLYS